jgi:succinate dehydrogenase hydrophobic anchor subunit
MGHDIGILQSQGRIMKAKLLLRIAAVIMLLHTIGHTFGALGWKNAPNEAVKQVIDGMQNNRFDFMGRTASLADFYSGYGVTMIGVLLLIAIMLWLLSEDTTTSLSEKLQTVLGLFLLFLAVAEYIYFFPFAASFSFLAGICTLLSRRK